MLEGATAQISSLDAPQDGRGGRGLIITGVQDGGGALFFDVEPNDGVHSGTFASKDVCAASKWQSHRNLFLLDSDTWRNQVRQG